MGHVEVTPVLVTPESAVGINSMCDNAADDNSSDDVECPTCGKDGFKGKHGLHQHHAMAHGESLVEEIWECGWCGDDVTIRDPSRKEAENVFCGSECESKWRSENYSREKNGNWEPNGGTVYPEQGEIICRGCNRELPVDDKHFYRSGAGFESKCKECQGTEFGNHHINKVKDAKDGHKFCVDCNRELPKNRKHFFRCNDLTDYVSRCKECMGYDFQIVAHNRGRDDGSWRCPSCEEVLERTSENFYPIPSGNDGLQGICKECSSEKSVSHRHTRWHADEQLTASEWEAIKEAYNHKCAYCGDGSERLERDHIVPVSKDGTTTVVNIAPACRTCNSSKGDRSVSEWYPKQDHYDPERMDRIVNAPLEKYNANKMG